MKEIFDNAISARFLDQLTLFENIEIKKAQVLNLVDSSMKSFQSKKYNKN
jgi:hypothetical protein